MLLVSNPPANVITILFPRWVAVTPTDLVLGIEVDVLVAPDEPALVVHPLIKTIPITRTAKIPILIRVFIVRASNNQM